MRNFFIIGLTLFIAKSLSAQYYETGVEPLGVKWRQISNGKIRLIYPSDYEHNASAYLNILKTTDTLVGKDYGIGKTKIDVVLHNQSVISNGFVAWAPRRMELITHPAFSGYSQPWSYQLATHEMRHVKQMYALNRNSVRTASFILGQQATGLAAGFVPLWYLEGDAVASETAFSSSGRGRTAPFFQHYRAHYLSNRKPFKYDKWLLGSYKDHIPNHYNFGYQIVTYGQMKYGFNVWTNTIDYVTRKPQTIFPFYFGLKKYTGLSRKELTHNAFRYQDSVWTENSINQRYTETPPLIKNSKEYKNYEYPCQVDDSTVIALITSLNDIPSFNKINIKTNKETILLHPGFLLGRPYINDSLLIWSEYKPHARWEYKNFGKIIKYNFKTNQKKIFENKGMFGIPIYRASDNSIYCVEYSPQGNFSLIKLSENLHSQKVAIFPDEVEPFELAVDEKNNQILIGVTTPKGKEILALLPDNTTKVILGPTFLDINSIKSKGNLIAFAATQSYTEKIFVHNLQNNITYDVINPKYGSRHPSFGKDESLIFSNYTIDGYRLCKIETLALSSAINLEDPVNNFFSQFLSDRVKVNIDTINFTKTKYDSKPYRGLGTLINIHSWAPFYFNPYSTDPEGSEVKLGATLISQNLTGTTVLVLGYGYGESHLFRAKLSYRGLWPVFTLGYEQYDNYATLYSVNNAVYFPNARRSKIAIQSYLPFTLSNNSYTTYLQIYNSTERTNDYFLDKTINKYRSGLIQTNSGIYFHTLRHLSHRDLLPRYGLIINLFRIEAPYNKNYLGSLNAIKSILYAPGLFNNHHIKLTGSIQYQQLRNYYFENKVDPPRGYNLYMSENYKGFSVDYLFPLAYPDMAIGSLTYIKRLSVDLFFDKAINSYPLVKQQNLQSLGFEVNLDLHFFRTRYPFRLKYLHAFTGDNFSQYSKVSLTYNISDIKGNWNKQVEH